MSRTEHPTVVRMEQDAPSRSPTCVWVRSEPMVRTCTSRAMLALAARGVPHYVYRLHQLNTGAGETMRFFGRLVDPWRPPRCRLRVAVPKNQSDRGESSMRVAHVGGLP